MTRIGKRKVTRTGCSLTITLPDKFVKQHGIKQGDRIVVEYDRFLKVIPELKQ